MVEYFKNRYRARNQRRGEYDAVRRKELIICVVPYLCVCPINLERHSRFCQQQLMFHKAFRHSKDGATPKYIVTIFTYLKLLSRYHMSRLLFQLIQV